MDATLFSLAVTVFACNPEVKGLARPTSDDPLYNPAGP